MPSLFMTEAPSPKKRIFKPLKTSTDLISSRNQPEASGTRTEQCIVLILEGALISAQRS